MKLIKIIAFYSLLLVVFHFGFTSCQGLRKISLPDNVLIIRNGTIIDGSGEKPIERGLIAIQSDTVFAVGLEEQFRLPNDREEIDAGGGTILPGFIDSHTHILGINKNKDNLDSLKADLSFWLKTGITTIRDLGSHYGKIASIQSLRDSLGKWGNSVPRVVLAGPYIGVPEGHPVASGLSPDRVFEASNAEEAYLIAEHILSKGADGLKISVERRFNENVPIPSASQVAAVAEVAHNQDKWVSAHVTLPVDAEIAILNGVDDLAHPPAGQIPERIIDEMISRDVLLGTTLLFQDGKENRYWLRQYNLPGVDTTENRKSQIKDHRRAFYKSFLAKGGKITLGSDFPYFNFGRRGGMPMEEMYRMLETGMSPVEVIIAATANAALACGLEEEIGTLEVGKKADIIIVRGNPIENISAMNDVFVVIKNGKVVHAPQN